MMIHGCACTSRLFGLPKNTRVFSMTVVRIVPLIPLDTIASGSQ